MLGLFSPAASSGPDYGNEWNTVCRCWSVFCVCKLHLLLPCVSPGCLSHVLHSMACGKQPPLPSLVRFVAWTRCMSSGALRLETKVSDRVGWVHDRCEIAIIEKQGRPLPAQMALA